MEALWVALTLLVAAGVGWPVTIGVLKLARSVDEHETTARHSKAGGHGKTTGHEKSTGPEATTDPPETSAHAAADETPEFVLPNPPAHDPATPDPATPDPATPDPATPAPRQGVLRGGLVIGVLERLGVALAILANEPVAIAYVVAIKGLGRYAELKETPAVAERFIIGTLTSLLWAAGVATVAAVYLL